MIFRRGLKDKMTSQVEEDLLPAIRDAGSADMRQLRFLIFVRNVERGFDNC